MKKLPVQLSYLGAVILVTQSASGAMFSTDFNTDQTANWTVNATAGIDYIVDPYYDSSAIGVGFAPNGTGTRVLKMTANNTAGILGGLSVSPTGLSLSGSYRLSFDMWQNYAGPLGTGGNGTTQLSMYGIGTTGTLPPPLVQPLGAAGPMASVLAPPSTAAPLPTTAFTPQPPPPATLLVTPFTKRPPGPSTIAPPITRVTRPSLRRPHNSHCSRVKPG
ncbi:MAG: hypothetical protein QM813_04385 [Verrucomicrobiota bacterium]